MIPNENGGSSLKKTTLLILIIFVAAMIFGAPKLSVGAKNFTEQYVVSSMISKLLEANGFSVKENFGMSSFAVRSALETGQIDLYADYTGTAWPVYLKHNEIIRDPQELYEAVKEEDYQKNNIVWLDMVPYNNTYALAVTQETSRKYNLKTLEDLGNVSMEHPEFLYAIDFEFYKREDGFWPVVETYGMKVEKKQVKTMEIGLSYQSLANNQVDAAMVFTTDGQLEKYDLVVLEDTKKFFPSYNLAVTVRKEILDEYPEIIDILKPLHYYLSEPIMIRLNYLVDGEGMEPDKVAENFLKGLGLID